jgi:hypothetical protein
MVLQRDVQFYTKPTTIQRYNYSTILLISICCNIPIGKGARTPTGHYMCLLHSVMYMVANSHILDSIDHVAF